MDGEVPEVNKCLSLTANWILAIMPMCSVIYFHCRHDSSCKLHRKGSRRLIASDEAFKQWELAPGEDVYGKFKEALFEDQDMCKSDSFPVCAREISSKVTFECKSHVNKAALGLLRDQLLTISAKELSKI
jgi:hypothetical protein